MTAICNRNEGDVFYYFGRKGRLAGTYEAPEYPLVIEPFAGSMGYSMRHRPAHAIGIEADVEIHNLWHRLCNMTMEELAEFELPPIGTRCHDRWVITCAISNGSALSNYRTINPFIVEHFEDQRKMTMKHHKYARSSVLYSLGDYRQAPDVECTWFIDPPYEDVRGYRHGSHLLDYDELAEWCMTRRGQVIICEGWSAKWLPFQHHSTMQGMPGPDGNLKRQIETVLTRRTHARCKQCNTTFPATRADAKFCSARCRMRASRERAR